MREEFTNDVAVHLSGKISDDDLRVVMRELRMLVTDYEIESRKVELALMDDIAPKCFQAYMVAKKIEGLSGGTLNVYRLYLEDFLQYIGKPLLDVTANDIRVYLYTMQNRRGITNRSLDGKRLVINGFLEWCFREGYISKNPCKQISPIKYEAKPREPLSGIELELVRYACRNYRERAMVEMFYSTGCRVSEMVILNRSDIDFTTGEVSLFGKGQKYRQSYINAKAEVALKKYLFSRTDNDPALFVSERKPHKRLSKTGIEYLIRKIGERSGIGRNLYPHLIRHTTATDALNRGMNVVEVQKILGHEKLDTTMIYAKVLQDSVKYSHKKYIV